MFARHAITTALLSLCLSGIAQAQAQAQTPTQGGSERKTPSPAEAKAFKEAFNQGVAMALLPMEQLIVEGCRKLAPGTSQGMEASWAKRMANPALKAHTQTPEYAKELADNRRLLDAEMAQPNAIQEWGPKCQQGLD
jgi:hypothetical protein